jgi:hypothetical protein
MGTMRNAIWIGAAWLCLAAGIFVVLGSINLSVLFEIARDPVSTDATVVLTDCANHATVHYSYEVEGQAYAGRSTLGNECKSLKKGDKIRIYFSRRSPALSEARDPHDALIGELTVIVLAAFFFPPAIIGLVYLRREQVRKLLRW